MPSIDDPAAVKRAAVGRNGYRAAGVGRNGQDGKGDRVSVVVTTYYRNDRLREALESVRDQRYGPVEAIVVDGSEDRYAEPVVEEFGDCRYLLQGDHQLVDLEGPTAVAAARDLGVAHASGRYVHFLDDDDRLLPDAIAKQVALLSAAEGVEMVYCGIRDENGPERMPPPGARGQILERALRLQVTPCVPSAMLVSRALLAELPPMESLPHGDASLLIEIAQRTEVDFVDEALVVRGHPGDTPFRAALPAGLKRTLSEYGHLYGRFPPEVRRTALARTYYTQGVLAVSRHAWSSEAIRAFALANYYAPEPEGWLLTALVGSLFGRTGWSVGSTAYGILSGDVQREGNVGLS